MKFYLEKIEDIFTRIRSSEEGLSSGEAEKRLLSNGKNKLREAKKDSLLKRFVKQLLDPMIIILIAAAVISAITSAIEHEFPTDVIIILAVVLINAVLGVYQESKAEKAIEALQEMSAATSKVLRDGKLVDVKSEMLVTGDIIYLEAGDAVPADCRIFESASLKIEEAALTGESVPVSKIVNMLTLGETADIALGDRKNMAYMGSSVVYGRGKAVVVATGMDTEMGKIADAIAQAKESQTPLQIKLSQLSKILSVLVIGISIFIFAFGVAREYMQSGGIAFHFVLDTFMLAVSLAVAAIPEGLAAVVTIVLSIGVTNMSKRNAIIRKLTAVETLGCAQIICSDKTGTLTQNKMTVTNHFGEDKMLIAEAMALCTDVTLDGDGKTKGEPTECSLVNFALSLGLNKNELMAAKPRVGEAPFDSMRKMMSTIHQLPDGSFIQYTKGAPDEILKKCSGVFVNGEAVPLTDTQRSAILSQNKAMADQALRVLSVAYKKYSAMPQSAEPADIENELVFIGLTGMIDPVRPEVKDAIDECGNAGIRPIMITGDHRDTAVAIAMQLGIISDPSQAITGAQLDTMDEEEFSRRVTEFSVYARVQPEHKVRIVNAWRAGGYVTAMTGDGVNDAPSIKSADIGIGMGITGTDVTKNVADMVLADDNFATIVSAVSEGRRIYDNIRKAIQFLLGSNLSEVLSIFIANLIGFVILKPVHLLWINLVTDAFPALALGMEKAENNVMLRRPRNPKEGIFAAGLGVDVFYQGAMVTLLTLAAYFIGNAMGVAHLIADGTISATAGSLINQSFLSYFGIEAALKAGEISSALAAELHGNGITMAFLTMSMAEIFHSFNMRSQRASVIKMGLRGSHNKYLHLATVASFVATAAVIYVPFLRQAFDFTRIALDEYAVSIALAVSVIPIVEIVKFFQRRAEKNKA